MTELRIEDLALPAADLGPENPFPSLAGAGDLHASVQCDPEIPAADRAYIGFGNAPGCLPYRVQDGYTRRLKPGHLQAAVLENEVLRAAFLLEYGGRLYSLLHKPTGRELLEVNPVFQPANLAIRNAWFSGGVEWNIGLVGHCPFTCSPLFAARVEGPGGTPALRLYEWERIRGVPFQIDAYLPDGSPVLFVRVRISNPNPVEVPMYWWSNMAVPETPDTRVLVPAEHAYQMGYGGKLLRVPVPEWNGTDLSYSTRLDHAMDFFFRIPDSERPWISALDSRGGGLVQTSTDLLKGRKLFVWGQAQGGGRWQEFLSRPGHAYLEIQAGLARTQYEHLPMPAGAEWSWLEAYGLMQADPEAVHGRDWPAAVQCVQRRLEALIPRQSLEREFRRGAEMAESAPQEILRRASGWGALERIRRKAMGERPLCSGALVFDDSTLGPEQEPWLNLLRTGRLPPGDAAAGTGSFMVQREWRDMLERSPRPAGGQDWLAPLHLGIMRAYAGEMVAAREAFQESLAARRTAWALRNLAVLERKAKRLDSAGDLMEEALRLRPDLLPLALECGAMLLEAGRHEKWMEMLSLLPASARECGRIVMLEGRAALLAGRLDRVAQILEQAPTVDDMREGEVSLSDLWFGLHEQRVSRAERRPVDAELKARVRRDCPPPRFIDFRMGSQG
ncbi:MAG: DUF5107 domain-containing protein [Lentisphaerae bacterium]|nr:DUF5107 domain-containing protein [Lentisphaerota bacterium]